MMHRNILFFGATYHIYLGEIGFTQATVSCANAGSLRLVVNTMPIDVPHRLRHSDTNNYLEFNLSQTGLLKCHSTQ